MKYIFFAITYFCSSYIYRRRNRRLRSCCIYAIPWMPSCGALQRSNNTYIESIMEPVFLRIRKRFSLCGFDWEENPEKELRQWKKVP